MSGRMLLRGYGALVLAGWMVCASGAMRAQDAGQDGQQQGHGRRGGGMGMMGMGSGNGQAVRGSVTAVSGSSLTVKTETGESFTVDVTDNTRLIKERQPVKLADVKAGDAIVAMGMPEQGKSEIHAAMLMVLTPEQAAEAAAREKEMRENLGKTYIVGRVAKIDETKLTIERPDKVSQVIEVDENTSFRKGGRFVVGMVGSGNGMGGGRRPSGSENDAAPQGESITLADIKVGDMVNGTGALKGSTFVPKQLNVMVRRERAQANGAGASTAAPQ